MLAMMLGECLAPHNLCTGEYHDFTGAYRIRCACTCHTKKSGLSRPKRPSVKGKGT